MFSNLKGDLLGGITAGIVALPLALAFGVSSGLGASAGLYGAIFIGFFAALFGGTSTQISGPTAPMTAVSMVVVASIISANDGDVTKALPVILSVFLLAGLLQIGLGVLGIGKYIRFIPYPVVSGFMTAIGVIILITQILPSVGYYANEDVEYVKQFQVKAKDSLLKKTLKNQVKERTLTEKDFEAAAQKGRTFTQENIIKESENLAKKSSSGVVGTFKVLGRAFSNISWLELLLSLGTIFIIYGFKRITTVVPSTLVALIVMTVLPLVFGWDYKPISKIPSGFPTPNLEIFSTFSISSVAPYLFTALTLALLGTIDSLLTSVVADNMTKTKHKPNKELIGQGIGNSIASIFGGIPGAGATIRTVVNINSGGKTKLSGMVAGIMLLVVLLGLGPVASKIPAAVLAGILITVGIGVMDYKGLKAIPSLPKDFSVGKFKLSSEAIIMTIVLVLSTFWNLVNAVGVGLVIACIFKVRSLINSFEKNTKVEKQGDKECVQHLSGSLFFGTSSYFKDLLEEATNLDKVVIDFKKVDYIDQSGTYALEDAVQQLKKENVEVSLVNITGQPLEILQNFEILSK